MDDDFAESAAAGAAAGAAMGAAAGAAANAAAASAAAEVSGLDLNSPTTRQPDNNTATGTTIETP